MRHRLRFVEANSRVVMPGNVNQSNVLALSKQNLMKKSMLLLVAFFIFTSVALKAQSQQKINFQSIVRNTSGVIVSNKSVNFKITILSGSITGEPVYSETHLKTTDAIGLVSLQIGSGTVSSGVFSSIDWGNTMHFIKLEADFSGGNTYVTLGTQELMSVPYAMYASKTDTNSLNLTNRFADKAPINNPEFTGTVYGINKNMVGLENVNNTSDASKPVSTLTQAALDTKFNKSDFPRGNKPGEFLYWNGQNWQSFEPGSSGQTIIIDQSGNPTWGCIIPNTAAAPSSSPTLVTNTALTAPITVATTGATGIGTATGLPGGVTASWSSNSISISGTPTATGIFNYTIPLTGGCGTVNATGTITVTAANTAGAASSTPTLCISNVLTNITHTTTGATGIGSATGLPAGVSAAWASNTITISGIPTVTGTFNYSIPLTGGYGSVNATGTITVTAVNIAGTASSNPTLVVNTALTTSIMIATTGATGILNDAVSGSNGLPAGVSATWASNMITISGTPSASGIFSYSIPLTGGCGSVNATGTITVEAAPCGSTITYNGYDYKTVGIGTQCWMAENLRTRKYNDGTDIPFNATGGAAGNDLSQTWGTESGAHTLYEHDSTAIPSKLTSYGYLYNWYAAKGIASAGSTSYKNICPSGWYVPTDAEWTTLTDTLGGLALAGTKMKKNDALWSTNTGTPNSSGFSALPGGYRDSGGSFFSIRNSAFFWSTTGFVYDFGLAWSRYLNDLNGNVSGNVFNKSVGASVRCLRD